MPQPHESTEFKELFDWQQKAKEKILTPYPALCSWSDICGFSDLLTKSNWDLYELQNNNSLILLNEFHALLGTSLMIGVASALRHLLLIL